MDREWTPIDHAYINMDALLREAGLDDASFRRDVDDAENDNRFAFVVTVGERTISVLMPGRSQGVLKGGVHQAPRLYINGNSFWWKYAVDILREHAKGAE